MQVEDGNLGSWGRRAQRRLDAAVTGNGRVIRVNTKPLTSFSKNGASACMVPSGKMPAAKNTGFLMPPCFPAFFLASRLQPSMALLPRKPPAECITRMTSLPVSTRGLICFLMLRTSACKFSLAGDTLPVLGSVMLRVG